MLVSGFTIIRNAVKFDFPFLESVRSLLPICDEYVINVGVSEDTTLDQIEALKRSLPPAEAQKIRIVINEWPLDQKTKRFGGQILADQTNLALKECKGTWCFYLQGDEVLHEQDLPELRRLLERLASDRAVQGVVLNYNHFYGAFDIVQRSRAAYRREIRVVRNGLGIQSTGDAQSFRNADGTKLNAVLSPAHVYHYGWVRPQELMRLKTAFMDTLYHAKADSADAVPATGDAYLYKRFVGLERFEGTHPKVMAERIGRSPRFDFSRAPKVFHLKDTWKWLSGVIERVTGIRLFEFKNYRLIYRK